MKEFYLPEYDQDDDPEFDLDRLYAPEKVEAYAHEIDEIVEAIEDEVMADIDLEFYAFGEFQIGFKYDKTADKGVFVLMYQNSPLYAVIDHSFECIKNICVSFYDDIEEGGHFRIRNIVDVFKIETKVGVSSRKGAKELYTLLKELGATVELKS